MTLLVDFTDVMVGLVVTPVAGLVAWLVALPLSEILGFLRLFSWVI